MVHTLAGAAGVAGAAVGKMRNCGMQNAEGKMRNGMC